MRFPLLTLLGIFLFSSARAQEAPSKADLSYALGMHLGLQIKKNGVDVDTNLIAKAIKDVLHGNPTELEETQIRNILRRAESYAHLKLSSKYIAEGETFLAKNAKEPGVTVLPDGLQYRVIKTGTGPTANLPDILTIKFRGTWPDGKEFARKDKLEIPFFGCTQGLREALKRMKVGSEWQIYIPYNIAYGHLGQEAEGYGSVLIYDLELLNAESETAHPNQHHSAGRLGHTLDEDILPPKITAASDILR